MGGRTNFAELRVSEPEPGRVLVEQTVDGGTATRPTIATDFSLPGGILVPLLRWLMLPQFRKICARELDLLTRYLAEGRDLTSPE